MRLYFVVGGTLIAAGLLFLGGRQCGTDLVCRQMGYEGARAGDGGVVLCAKTVTFKPTGESR